MAIGKFYNDSKSLDEFEISKKQYLRWKKQVIFDALSGLHSGQSFCSFFDIQDNLLFFTSDAEWCEKYIQRNYVR